MRQSYGQPHSVSYGSAQPGYAPQTASTRPRVSLPLTKAMFRTSGMLVLLAVCGLPAWDAWSLLTDFNYIYWASPTCPRLMLAAIALTFIAFLAMTEVVFSQTQQDQQQIQTLVMAISAILTLLGLVFIVLSNPIAGASGQANRTLVYHCMTNPDTQALRQHYDTLFHLRAAPSCAVKYSIEECDGFKAMEPHTSYLKASETNFRCSGVCMSATDGLGQEASISNNASSAGGAIAMKFPPTLFSDANFKVSCDGAAARQLVYFARDIANQSLFAGIGLIVMSIVLGLCGFTGEDAK